MLSSGGSVSNSAALERRAVAKQWHGDAALAVQSA